MVSIHRKQKPFSCHWRTKPTDPDFYKGITTEYAIDQFEAEFFCKVRMGRFFADRGGPDHIEVVKVKRK